MIARYELVLNVPNRNDGSERGVGVGRFKTVERALRAAERILSKHEVVTTRYCYHRDSGWGYSCSIYDTKSSGRVRLSDERLDAPVHIVPSVGELGWSP